MLGPIFAAYAQQQFSYGMVMQACIRRSTILMHWPALLGLGVTIASGMIAWKEWSRRERDLEVDDDPAAAGAPFFGLVGLCLSGLALVLILSFWIPTLLFDPCRL
jgi:hypothetical protein